MKGAVQRKKMGMNPEELKIVVKFVESNPGSSMSEIAKACPTVQYLSGLLAEASEGAKPKEGYILKCSGGLYYPGPFVNLGY